ncbi:hypothetical protein U0070_015256 [Myodes glareolus]|uniref:Uncharacterized protein n=1 Tax=Myodes glareolus TaxID=447135 RepID=A0AAW0K0T9_MYOGA
MQSNPPRRKMAELNTHVNVKEKELQTRCHNPCWGNLIRMEGGEKDWQNYIERLLHCYTTYRKVTSVGCVISTPHLFAQF